MLIVVRNDKGYIYHDVGNDDHIHDEHQSVYPLQIALNGFIVFKQFSYLKIFKDQSIIKEKLKDVHYRI